MGVICVWVQKKKKKQAKKKKKIHQNVAVPGASDKQTQPA